MWIPRTLSVRQILSRLWSGVFGYAGVVLAAVILALILKSFVVEAIQIPSRSMEGTLLVNDYVLVNKLTHGSSSPDRSTSVQAATPLIRLPKLRQLERGDVVVFELPEWARSDARKRQYFVKRCIGVGGDKVEIVEGRLYVNDRLQHIGRDVEDFGPVVVPRKGDRIELTAETPPLWIEFIEREGHRVELREQSVRIDGVPTDAYTVQRNYVFVVGDNLERSYDSRVWGFLPEENIIGQATLIYWSVGTTGNVRWDRIGKLVY